MPEKEYQISSKNYWDVLKYVCVPIKLYLIISNLDWDM